jgi:hypothetical protein
MHPQPSGPDAPAAAWQPFTWSGVAAFAGPVSFGWFLWAFGVALLVGFAGERFVQRAWLPAVDAAVHGLPSFGGITRGRLDWPSNTVAELGKTTFLALRVNPQSTPVPGQAADVEVELGASEVSVRSLFGYWILPYPASLELAVNRPALEPLWATTTPYVQAAVLAVSAGAVCLGWALLALLAAPVIRLVAAVLRRDVTFSGCWRMAVMAMLPGALMVAAALALYASGGFRLVDLVVAFGLAHLLDLVLLAGAPWCLPRRSPKPLFGVAEAEPPAGDDPSHGSFRTAAAIETGSGPRSPSPSTGSVAPGPKANPFAAAGEPASSPTAPRPEPPARPSHEPGAGRALPGAPAPRPITPVRGPVEPRLAPTGPPGQAGKGPDVSPEPPPEETFNPS